jgi:hypothetical protein
VLKDLGLIRAIPENTRLHEHVPATSFDKVVKARMALPVPPESKLARRKAKEG